ncbi:hypothetical protein RND81_08G077700 [Saponaria officinalis]|uniref:Transposase n=1 Tax=Saponaria officinalis TaxID=3572 RepID=A0AAW1J505_SAPOF
MYESIHIDEKWFYMTKASERYYLLPDEEEPHRCLKSKTFITKVMFMAAVGRPMYAEDGMLSWDGKIGIFPFMVEVPAKRARKNRGKGVLEVKPIASITKEVIRDCLIQKVIPAVKAKWPNGRSKDFFRSIQKIQYEKAPKSVSALVDAVTKAYDECNPKCLHYNWLSLQYCMNEILKVKGNNNYKLLHMGKKRLNRLGILQKKFNQQRNTQGGEASERVITEDEIIGDECDA